MPDKAATAVNKAAVRPFKPISAQRLNTRRRTMAKVLPKKMTYPSFLKSPCSILGTFELSPE
jgi:hypothetical protein